MTRYILMIFDDESRIVEKLYGSNDIDEILVHTTNQESWLEEMLGDSECIDYYIAIMDTEEKKVVRGEYEYSSYRELVKENIDSLIIL